MIITVNWNTFHLKFFNQQAIYVKEDETSWILLTNDNHFFIKCIVEKSDSPEQNIMFRERYLNNNQNMIFPLSIDEENQEKIQEEEESSKQVEEIEEVGGSENGDK